MRNKRKKYIAAIVILPVILVLLLVGTGIYFHFFYGLSQGRILENITVAGVDVGGMTVEEATAAISEKAAAAYGAPMKVTIESYSITIPADTAKVSLDVTGAVEEAFHYGRNGDYHTRKAQQLTAATFGYSVNIAPYLLLDSVAIRTQLEPFRTHFDSILTQNSYTVDGPAPDLTAPIESIVPQTLIITKGTTLYSFDFESLLQKVLTAYQNMQSHVEAACTVMRPDDLDIQSIYNQYCSEAADAFIDPETFQITAETNGYTFDLEETIAAFEALPEGGQLDVTFYVTAPDKTCQSIYDSLFKDVLSTFTATSVSQYNRDTNLKIACDTINGMILYPGDEFSYNPALGERTPEKGYLQAASYSGMETISTYGGGICQVSSCIYYCAVVADLEILQRHCHTFNTGYMPAGTDATVDWSGPNLRFRNNTDYPIRIDAHADGGSTTITFMGTDDKNYYIKFENTVTEIMYAQERVEEFPPDNPKGYTDGQVISTAYNGCKAVTYRAKYDKQTNELISREQEDSSVYSARDRVICKIVNPNPSIDSAPADPTTGAVTPDE